MLTDAGRRLFETMQKKETDALAQILGAFAPAELRTTGETLARLAGRLAAPVESAKESGMKAEAAGTRAGRARRTAR